VRLPRSRDVRRFVGIHETPIGIGLGLVLCAIAFALVWHEAVEHTLRGVRLEQLQSLKKVNAEKLAHDHARSDSSKQISAANVQKSDTARARAANAKTESDEARVVARNAQAKVGLRGDTAIVGASRQVLLPEIGSMIRATLTQSVKDSITIRRYSEGSAQDSSTIGSLQQTIADQAVELEDHYEREQLLQEEIDLMKPSRCGIKCGAAIGAGVTLTIVKILAVIL
jgi:hypothetical protein